LKTEPLLIENNPNDILGGSIRSDCIERETVNYKIIFGGDE